jgi:hypothetical protein
MYVTLKLEPMKVTKPRLAVEEAADVARRIGCCVSVAVNGVGITISPTTPKGQAFDAWNAAARAEGMKLEGGGTAAAH